MSIDTVTVKLLDKDFQVACPVGQQDALLQSAHYLNQQMGDIRATGKVIGMERIAVMAALNITNDLLQNSEPKEEKAVPAHSVQIKGLNEKLENALHRFSQMEIG